LSATARTVSGKLLIFTAIGLALALAGGAWLYHYRQQRRPIELWGAPAARLLAQGTTVEALRLSTNGEPATGDVLETLTVGGQRFRVVETRDLAGARGLVHFRGGLLNTQCFDWSAPISTSPDWRYALRIRDGNESATFLFAPAVRELRLLERGQQASIAPIGAGLEEFFNEQFVAANPSRDAP
jgi:hypothetical protein